MTKQELAIKIAQLEEEKIMNCIVPQACSLGGNNIKCESCNEYIKKLNDLKEYYLSIKK